MRKLLGAHYHNTLMFQDVTLNLAPESIVTVGGINRNARVAGTEADSNGVGKTLLFSYLANLMFERPDISAKAKSKKSLYGNEPGFARLYAQPDDREVCFEQDSNGRYRIFENGVSRGNDVTISNATDIMHSLLPISEEYWHQIAMLSSKAPTHFMTSKPERRRAFYSAIFNYDYYDVMLKVVKTRLADLRKHADRIEGFNASILKAQEQLASVPDYDATAHQSIQTELHALEAELAELPTARELKAMQAELADVDAKLAELPDEDYAAKASAYLDRTDEQLKHLQDSLAASRTLSAVLNSYQRQLAKLQGAVPGLTTDTLYAKLDAGVAAGQELAEVYPKYATDPAAVRTALGNLVSFYEEDGSPLDADHLHNLLRDAAKLQQDYSELEFGLEQAETEVSDQRGYVRLLRGHAESHGTTCPLCFGELDKPLATKLEDAVAELETAEQVLKQTRQRLNVVGEELAYYDRLVSLAAGLGVAVTDLPDVLPDAVTDLAAANLDANRDDLTALAELLDSIPEDVDADADLFDSMADISRKIEQMVEKRRAANAVLDQDEQRPKLEAKRAKLAAKLAGINVAELDALHAELYELRRLDNEHSHIHTRREEVSSMLRNLKVERDDLSQQLSDGAALEALAAAYSSNGVRLNKIKAVTELLTEALNDNAHMLFSESFSFDTKIGATTFDMLVTRNHGKTTDVSSLSKSESRRFELLHAYCLNLLLPSADRLSMMALDEMEDGSSDVNKRLYRDVFVPHLHELVPSLFVISPLAEMHTIENAKSMYVVKDGQFSHLETDYPELLELPAAYLME